MRFNSLGVLGFYDENLGSYTPDQIDAALRSVIADGASYRDIVAAAASGYGLTEQDVIAAYARIGYDPATNQPRQNTGGMPPPAGSLAWYYFEVNPDVAAEWSRNTYGLSADEFAMTHWERYGRAEGRFSPQDIRIARNKTYTDDEVDSALRATVAGGASYAEIVRAARVMYGIDEARVRAAYARIMAPPQRPPTPATPLPPPPPAPVPPPSPAVPIGWFERNAASPPPPSAAPPSGATQFSPGREVEIIGPQGSPISPGTFDDYATETPTGRLPSIPTAALVFAGIVAALAIARKR